MDVRSFIHSLRFILVARHFHGLTKCECEIASTTVHFFKALPAMLQEYLLTHIQQTFSPTIHHTQKPSK